MKAIADVAPSRLDLTDAASLTRELATRDSDPRLLGYLRALPNPDPVLRKLGRVHDVFDDLYGDAHVVGDLRSIRAALLGFEWRIQPGADDAASQHAAELARRVFRRDPAPSLAWSDVIWAMGCAAFYGYAVTEVVWTRADQYLVPTKVIPRSHRRFVFGTADGELRMLTRQSIIDGDPVAPYKFLLTRHMASSDNPYGIAIFSSCFWPWVFKHSGLKYFAKFAERYGIPWAIGKYPQGTTRADVDRLAGNLAAMVEDAVAAVPNDSSVELLAASTGMAQLPQERLIALCNRELSKALTSQTLASDLTGAGARAASETHREREMAVNESDRAMIEDSMNELLQSFTTLNFATAAVPRFEFFEESDSRIDITRYLVAANAVVPLSRMEVYRRLQLTPPRDEADTLPRFAEPDAEAAAASSNFRNARARQARAESVVKTPTRRRGWDTVPIGEKTFDFLSSRDEIQ